ncbi:cell division protein FtsK [Micromonospora sp. DT47]|uniref:cell division protein FtsK n=1 Tax=Micromonospora sp. DT47 TaxID=3393431 RepID=UPI003CF9F762
MSTDVIPHEQIEDAETVTVYLPTQGGPVDPDDAISTTWATITGTDGSDRTPIIPAWMRSKPQRGATLRQIGGTVAYHALFHASRSPKYLAKVAWYAPQGAGRAVASTFWWTVGGKQNYNLRQDVANKNDAFTWKDLNKVRAKESKAHWWLVVPTLVVVAAAAAVAYHTGAVPRIGWYAIAAALTLLAAYHGRPADKPILDRVSHGPRFTKLTGTAVRDAVVALSVGVKEPGQITFPPPGIHRDGPGWMARFNLPGAIVATAVLEKRDGLAAALRLPVDQVWPEVGGDHPGQVALWVGFQSASKMGQPRWSLAADNARTSVFESHEFGTDQRQRPVKTSLFARNFLVGGVPGSGKSYGARTLAIIAALDPTCELKIAEFKGTADFGDLAHLCTTYACGVDDQALGVGMEILAWGLAEAERRGERIRKARERGEAPEGKVTPELAARRGSGLHPVVIVIDEAHELFGDTTVGKEAAMAAERLIKRGRALGIIIVLATQIPDKTSLPPNITRCVTVRWCMAVQDQVANDMILGTGAYKRGLTATSYRPGDDAGWGVMTGLTRPTTVRSQFPDPETAASIVARATALRGGGVVGKTSKEKVKARDMLADAWACLRPGESGMPWAVLAERLAELAPEFYTGITADMVRESLARYDVPTQDVKVEGRNIKGVRRTALDAAQQARQIADK